jgi:6-phosphogluconate dehydrogenase (decarboxylating)
LRLFASLLSFDDWEAGITVPGLKRIEDSMNYSELFYLVDAGEGRWIVKHAITNEVAGTLMRTSQGVVLRNEDSRFIGAFPTIESALRNLYALV